MRYAITWTLHTLYETPQLDGQRSIRREKVSFLEMNVGERKALIGKQQPA